MSEIKIWVVEPGKDPVQKTIPNELKALQNIVGGYIEHYEVSGDMGIICNEEGRLLNLTYNANILGMPFFGTIAFVGVSGEEFADCPMSELSFKRLFPTLWEVSV